MVNAYFLFGILNCVQSSLFFLFIVLSSVYSHWDLGTMVDIAVKSGSDWICPSQGPNLADILLSVHVSDENSNEQFIHSEEDQTSR